MRRTFMKHFARHKTVLNFSRSVQKVLGFCFVGYKFFCGFFGKYMQKHFLLFPHENGKNAKIYWKKST